MEDIQSRKIRMAAFEWLSEQVYKFEDVLPWKELSIGFQYQGQRIPLLGRQGIWKPAAMESYPLSITTVPESIYEDRIFKNDKILYHYRGTDPGHRDNRGLREAMKNRIPLIYFVRIIKGKYLAHWPVFVESENKEENHFIVRADVQEILKPIDTDKIEDKAVDIGRRQYVTSNVIIRLHQRTFREKVLAAYREHCAICNLKHRELLDAAHIMPDNEGGEPIVQNGLALCKIHHAAFDKYFIGIRSDYTIEVRKDILEEIDGPMLRYGLQYLHNKKIMLPSMNYRPKSEFLDYRYNKFLTSVI